MVLWTANYIHLGVKAAKNTHYFEKSSKWKLFKIEFCTKKFGSVYVYFPWSGAMILERLIWLLYYTVLKLEIMFNLGLPPKIRFTSTKASNESCPKLNFIQESRWAQCPFPHAAQLRASKDWYGCYMLLKSQITFNLGLNTAKNTHYFLKKTSNKSCSKLNFVKKSSRGVKDRFFNFSMTNQSKLNFRKSLKKSIF